MCPCSTIKSPFKFVTPFLIQRLEGKKEATGKSDLEKAHQTRNRKRES